METYQTMLTVGFLFVLPQLVGFAASRVGRRGSAIAWALAAPGIVGVLWAVMTVVENHRMEKARVAGQYYCGEGMVAAAFVAAVLMGLHFAVGVILGVMDQRARSPKPH
jgi:hypothetical protein